MSNSILSRAADYCSTSSFERAFDEFASENAEVFMDAIECKPSEVEHKHEYQQLHEKYLKLFEDQISDFIEKEGESIESFYAECREAADGDYTALFEDHPNKWFVDHLLASMEYKHFYGLMVNEARRISRK